MKNIVVIVLLFSFLSLSTFAQEKITIGVGTDISNPAFKQGAAEKIATYLEKKLGIKVDFIIASKNTELIQLFQEEKIDVAFLNTFGYILAASEVAIEPLVVVGNADQKVVSYHSCIITKPESTIKTPEDIKKMKGQLDFLFVNPTSTSGHLLPRLYFNSIGLDYSETHFHKVNFAGNHLNAITAIKNKTAEIAACSHDDLQKYIHEGTVKESDVNVIWKSDPIVNGPVAVTKTMKTDMKQKLMKAFMSMGTEQPDLQEAVQKLWHTNKNSKGFSFVPAEEKLYDSIKAMADSMEELILIINYYID